jgi:hypothetical protein
MQSASQAAAFYREVAERRLVWTIRDDGGFPAPLNHSGERVQPFWSSRARVERIIATVAAYRDFTPFEITLDVFLERWVPGLTKDGILVGVNWTGGRATGYDIAPVRIAECIAAVSRAGP